MRTFIRRGWRWFNGLLVLAMLLMPAPPVRAASQVSIKISHTLGADQQVLEFRVSPDGSRIVYRVARIAPALQDNPPPPPADLFSVPATGGTAAQLNPPATQATESVTSFQFSPDGAEVIYTRTTTDTTLGNVFEIFRVPVTGGTSTSVSGPIAIGSRNLRDFVVNIHPATVQSTLGDGSVRTVNATVFNRSVPERIASIADGTSNTFFFGEQVNNLLQFPYGGTERKLNPSLTSGGVVYDFAVTSDGTRAIYRADQNLDGTIELFSVPADGSDVGFRISGPLVAGGDVLEFKVNATSTRAVYRADQTTNGVTELYSARTNGGVVSKLNTPLVAGGEVKEFQFSPDGNLVVYLADQDVDGQFGLYATASTGGGVTRLSRGAVGQNVRVYRLSPDGADIYFVEAAAGGPLALFRRHLVLGGALTEQLPVSPVANVAVPDLKITADGTRMVYLADLANDGLFEVASLALSGPASFVPQLNSGLVAGGNIRAFQVSPDGQRVVYAADQNVAGTVELFSVPIGGGTVERVNGPLAAGGSVRAGPDEFQFSPDGHAVYYLADQETAGKTELFAAFDAPALAFTQEGYVVAEDGSLATQLAVQRSGATFVPSSVRVELTGVTATGGASLGVAGVDFVDNARNVVFAAGEITKTFSVPIKNDAVAEPAETFSIQLFDEVQGILGPPNSATVTILDSATSPLLDDRTYQVAENTANGTPLAPQAVAIAATNVTTYTILSGNTNNAFRIDATGALAVNNSVMLDYEFRPAYSLVIGAVDQNGSTDRATWTVNLTNVNEPPIFSPQTRSIAENSPNGQLVGTLLSATDPEGGPITFTVSSSVFALSTGGQLSVKASSALDYETTKSFNLAVTATDRTGLSTVAPVTVAVLDVVEGDPTAITIDALSPGSATVGGGTFKLVVAGKNFTANSVVRWNGNTRTTILSSGKLIAAINLADIALPTTASITVLDIVTKKGSNAVPFVVKFGLVGVAALAIEPAGSQSAAGQITLFNLEWTHTTQPWRAMDEMDMRLVDDERIPLWVRYQETRDESGADISTVILLNADGTPAGSGRFGEAKILENDTVQIDLAQASFQGSGATGSNIKVRIPAIFKAAAAQDDPYDIEMYGVDDLGGEQGPNQMGEWTITNPKLYLPAVQR